MEIHCHTDAPDCLATVRSSSEVLGATGVPLVFQCPCLQISAVLKLITVSTSTPGLKSKVTLFCHFELNYTYLLVVKLGIILLSL